MLNSLSVSRALDSLVPITRFNRGEANKIFDEVGASGCKIVVKNNSPICVLLTPEKYKEMAAIIDDQYLLSLAQEREARDTGATITAEQLYAELGLTEAPLDDVSMEYGVDFE
ncbi:MAG: type II toxin-antitoxin system Phd/YefM family antitoxin [Oscillospiraceae bacterium]|jgi:hypothetical protein|nr:type II toxin-antitoxin system Phd/YefM family antitoxin [Oscillospiraceae bacterium]